jgi:PAS domain S-box-containing protein
MNKRQRHAHPGLPAFTPAIGLREVLESSPDLVFSTDPWGRLVWASSAFEAFTGHRVKDWVGRSCAELVARHDVPGLMRAFLRARPSGSAPFDRRLELARADGTTLAAEVRLRFLDSPDGERYLVGVARECSHDAEPRATPAANSEPAAVVKPVASAGPAEAAGPSVRELELERSLAEARESARAKGDFLAMMSHEIRTPMNGVIGMSSLLLQQELPSESRQLVELIRDSSQTLLALINDTLDYSRLEAGRMPVENLDFDLRVALDQVAAVLHPVALEKLVRLETRVSTVVPSRLKGDPGRIRQVLLNLGANAVKFAERGTVQLKVEREAEDDAQVTLLFQVTDSGPGIEPEAIARLFEPYAQSDGSIARRFGGSGLGLAISKRLIEAMGGTIGVESRLGEGSTFWFRVRLEKQSLAVGTPQAPAVEVALRGVRVLVADGNAGDREPLADVLGAWGCAVELAENGPEALRLVREAAEGGAPFAVAVLDRHLEGLDGEELGQAIRADQALDATRLVMVTNVGRPGDGGRVKAAGFSAYLMKPLAPVQLYEAMGEILQPAHDEKSHAERPLVTRHSLAEARRGKLRILLVDDDPVNQLVTTSALHRVGYNIEVANSGRRAIERTGTERWDLILMDMQMPDLDGCRATAAIRARERGSQRTPIIGITANADHKPDRDRCLASGMDVVLGKPINLELLTGTVEKYTSRDGRVSEPERPASAPAPLTVVSSHFDAPPAAAPGSPPPAFRLSRPAPGVSPTEGESEVPVIPDGPALDLEQLEIACMGLQPLRASLLQTFLHDVPTRLERLARAFDSEDTRRVEFEAHGLKGMCATIGANGCVILFGEIEDRAREDQVAAARSLLQPARDEVERTEQFIRRLEDILNRQAA